MCSNPASMAFWVALFSFFQTARNYRYQSLHVPFGHSCLMPSSSWSIRADRSFHHLIHIFWPDSAGWAGDFDFRTGAFTGRQGRHSITMGLAGFFAGGLSCL